MNVSLYLLLVYLTYTYGAHKNQDKTPSPAEDEDEKETGYDKMSDSEEEKLNTNWTAAVILSNFKPYFHDVLKYREPLYLCPGENYKQDGCLFIQENMLKKKVRKFIDCDAGEFNPSLVNTKKRCGDGTLYTAYYKVCKKTEFKGKEPQTEEEKEKLEKVEKQKKLHRSNIRKIKKDDQKQDTNEGQRDKRAQPKKQNSPQHDHKKEAEGSSHGSAGNEDKKENDDSTLISLLDSDLFHDVEIFSFCFDKLTMRTSYVKYKISIFDRLPAEWDFHAPQIEEFPSTGFGDFNFDLGFLPNLYQKANQQIFLDKLYNEDETEENRDFLVANEMIPSAHMPESLSRGLLYNFYNISAIWNSLKERWARIWIRIAQIQLLDQNGMQLTVYSGTFGQLRLEDEDLYLVSGDNQIDIPIIWWILLIDEKYNKGIIFALDNVPKGYELIEEHKMCEQSICPFGLETIQTRAGGYCCEITEERLINFNMPLVQVGGVMNFDFRVKKKEED